MGNEIVGVQLQVEPGNSEQTVADLKEQLRQAVAEAFKIGQQFGESSTQAKVAKDRIKELADQIAGAGKAAEGIADGLGKTEAPIKSMRTQIREATMNLVAMQQQFGDISPEAQAAARHVAELRDRLKDANEVAGLFDPEKKFQAVAGAAQGIAAGFQAAQGAMALFGGESKQVEQAILKVQAAMALTTGLSAIKASVEDFQRLRALLLEIPIIQKSVAAANTLAAATMRLFGAATVDTGVAFNVLRGAIVATGIGALIVAIGFVINKLSSFTSATEAAADAQAKLNKEIAETANKFTDEIAEIYEQDRKLQEARLKAQGATDTELLQMNREHNKKLIEERQQNYLQQLGQGRDATEAKKALDKAETDSQIFEFGAQQKAREEAEKKAKEALEKAKQRSKEAATQREQDLKRIAELEKQFSDKAYEHTHTAEEAELRQATNRFNNLLALYNKYGRDATNLTADHEAELLGIRDRYAKERLLKAQEAGQKILEEQQKQAEDQAKVQEEVGTTLKAQLDELAGAEKLSFDLRRSLVDEFYQNTLDTATLTAQQQTELEQAHSDARKKIAHEEMETKIRAAQAVSGALDGFAQLAGEQTAAGKAFAIASATIQAILGAQQAFTSLSAIPIVGPALGAVAAAGAIAAGIANIRKITAVQIPGKGGGGSAPSIGGGAPLAPPGPQAQLTQLDQNSINQMGNATVKAVVVESDITNNQQRINRIQNAAVFK